MMMNATLTSQCLLIQIGGKAGAIQLDIIGVHVVTQLVFMDDRNY